VLLASSGIHANGLSLARKLVERLPQATSPSAPGSLRRGAARAHRAVFAGHRGAVRAGITPHYCANITGHGWRKLLRHPATHTYRIHTVPAVTPVLEVPSSSTPSEYDSGGLQGGAHQQWRRFSLFVNAEDAQRHRPEVAEAQGHQGPSWPARVEAAAEN
jgi:phosphoribosylformylglycinamidine cyclo-ligase